MSSDPTTFKPTYMEGKRTAVRNRAPAPLQTTAEQILREAVDRAPELAPETSQRLADAGEVRDYQFEKRKDFEHRVKVDRHSMGNWLRYAAWEEKQGDFRRARSVYERALEVDYRDETVWVKYASMEMRHNHVQSARNVWNRAVTLLPRVDAMWQQWSHWEEMLGNVMGARDVYRRWMQWTPAPQAWRTYVNFEKRYEEWDHVRAAFEDFVVCHPEEATWMSYARFEQRRGEPARARAVFERALNELGDSGASESFFVAFAEFEIAEQQPERARVIFKFALDTIPKTRAQKLYKRFMAFEKQQGTRETIEEAIVDKRRFQYEEQLKANPRNYDIWFDYLRMEEEHGDLARVRALYDRATAQTPPTATERRFWARYVYLWIYYAVFEELVADSAARARQVLHGALACVPHKQLQFPVLWIHAADLEIRQKNLPAARKIMGNAIGRCPCPELYDRYIHVEYELLNFDKCRTLYANYLKHDPTRTDSWIKYAAFEHGLAEVARARALYEVAVSQPTLDRPELIWKAYIDFEIAEEEPDHALALYERLLQRTPHIKVWLSSAQYAAAIGRLDRARDIYTRADAHFKEIGNKDSRVVALRARIQMEEEHGDPDQVPTLRSRLPQKVMRRRKVLADDGTEVGWSEYYDYIFPEEDAPRKNNIKFMEMARRWAASKAQTLPPPLAPATAAPATPATPVTDQATTTPATGQTTTTPATGQTTTGAMDTEE